MRASRLLSLLMLLQVRGRMTARQLASELEVSVRTIYRDIDSLHQAGVALYGEPGPAGGFRLLGGYRTRLTGMSMSEAEALFLTAMPSAASDLGLDAALTAARLKLQSALPEPVRSRTQLVGDRFHVDAPGWYSGPDDAPHLAALATAAIDQRRVRVRYRRWREPTDVERVLEPYGMVLKAGTWYVAAAGDTHPEPRTYKANAVLDLELLDETFDRPGDFDLAEWWREHLRAFRDRLWQGFARVRISIAGRDRMREVMSRDVCDHLDRTASAPDATGWMTGEIPIESLTHARGEILRLGPEIVVESPPELRTALAEAAHGLSALYAGADRTRDVNLWSP